MTYTTPTQALELAYMGRKVKEWVGKTLDTPVPPRVRARTFTRKGGRCHRCGRKIGAGERWTCEHLQAVINGGANAESNLDVTCDWCLPAKNAEDVAVKSKTARIRAKHLGLRKPATMPGSRGSRWKKRMDGKAVLR